MYLSKIGSFQIRSTLPQEGNLRCDNCRCIRVWVKTTFLWKDWKWGLTIAVILLQNIKTHALERTSKYATLYNQFFLYSTKFVPNTDTVFCFGIFTILPNEKIRDHPRKTRGSGEKPWWLRVWIPNTPGAALRDRINYNIYHTYPYLPIYLPKSRKVKILQKKTSKKNLTRCKKNHCRPPENSVYKLRKTNISLFINKLFHIRVYLS